MELIKTVCQIVIALGIVNVWILRFNRPTEWRGRAASNMEEEFAVYGLPPWSVRVIGFLKLLFAACLVVGIWVPGLTLPAAAGMIVLMLAAVSMHLRVGDPLKKSLPAFTLLVLSSVVAFA